MIVRNLTIKIQGNRATTDSPVYLYQYDKNIHLIITLNNVKYEVTNDMFVSYTIVKPNSEVLTKTNCFIKNGKVHLILESNLFDGDEEVGTALCQLKLYDKELESSVALPPFAIHVLDGYKQTIEEFEEGVVVLMTQNELKLLSENEQALRVMDGGTKGSIKISELEPTIEATGMIPVVQNDKTMRYSLDGLATKQFVRESLNETLNEVTEQMDVVNQMAVSIEGKADETDLEQIRQDLAGHTHEELATKSELNAKADADDVERIQSNLGNFVHVSDIDNMIKEPVLNDAKSYTNGQVQEGIHSATTQANSYTDTKLQEAKTYTDDAIANLDLSGAGGSGNGLDVRVIGGENTQGYDWYEFTGSEFALEEFKANAKMLVLFDNVAFSYGAVKVDGLAQVSLCVATEHDYMGNGQIDRMLEVLIDTFEKRYTVYINERQTSDGIVFERYVTPNGEYARVLENQLSTYATTKSVDDKVKNKAHINHTHDMSKKEATSLMELKYFWQYFNYGVTYFTVDSFYPNAGEEYSIVLPSDDMMNMFFNGSAYSSIYEAHIFIDASYVPTDTTIRAKKIRTMDESTGEPTEFESYNIVWEETETTNLKAGDSCTLEIVLTYYGSRSTWLVKVHKYQFARA